MPLSDVQEVSHYVASMYHGLERLRNELPLSLRLFKEIHAILMKETREVKKNRENSAARRIGLAALDREMLFMCHLPWMK